VLRLGRVVGLELWVGVRVGCDVVGVGVGDVRVGVGFGVGLGVLRVGVGVGAGVLDRVGREDGRDLVPPADPDLWRPLPEG
jgi:hypothetical protein